MRAHNIINNNQILHGDQTTLCLRCEKKMLQGQPGMLTCDLFAVANCLVHIRCARSNHLTYTIQLPNLTSLGYREEYALQLRVIQPEPPGRGRDSRMCCRLHH